MVVVPVAVQIEPREEAPEFAWAYCTAEFNVGVPPAFGSAPRACKRDPLERNYQNSIIPVERPNRLHAVF
jgi:hypothetical protein